MTGSVRLIGILVVILIGVTLQVVGSDLKNNPTGYSSVFSRETAVYIGQSLVIFSVIGTIIGIVTIFLWGGVATESILPAGQSAEKSRSFTELGDEPAPLPSSDFWEKEIVPGQRAAEAAPAGASEPRLVALTGGLPSSVSIHKGIFLIGRSEHCDLVLSSQLASRKHAVLEWDGEILKIRDLGSSNTTIVNDLPIGSDTVLSDGDVIQIVEYQMEVEMPPPLSSTIVLPKKSE